MRKWVRRVALVILLLIFLGSAGMVLSILRQYRTSERLYDDAVTQFISVVTVQDAAGDAAGDFAGGAVTPGGGSGSATANQQPNQPSRDAAASGPTEPGAEDARWDGFISD